LLSQILELFVFLAALPSALEGFGFPVFREPANRQFNSPFRLMLSDFGARLAGAYALNGS
jgi:hypothetical protein